MRATQLAAAAVACLPLVGEAQAQAYTGITVSNTSKFAPDTRRVITAAKLQDLLNGLDTVKAAAVGPIFTGTMTAATLALEDSGSTDDRSAITMTPDVSASPGTLAYLLANPTVPGTMTADGAFTNGAPILGALGGLQPSVGLAVNLTGRSFSQPISPAPAPLGPSTSPMAGLYANVISNNGHANSRAGNVGAYRAAWLGQITAYANSADVFGGDLQINHDQSAPADISVIGFEIDMAKNGSRDCNAIGGPVYCAGMYVTSSTDGSSLFGPAYLVEGQPNSFHYGYVLNGTGVKDVGFFDNSNATTSLNIAGSHTTGISFSGTFTGQQIAGKSWTVDGSGNLAAATLTSPVSISTVRTQIAAGAPASSTATCAAGEIKVSTDGYLYYCKSANSWVRVQGTSF